MLTVTEKRVRGNASTEIENHVINIYPSVEKQTLIGFGGAFTEAAAYCYSKLGAKEKDAFLKKYFDRTSGAGYSVGRVHIGSCDFSLDQYSEAYCEDLSDFNIEQDKKYIIPMIKDALRYTGEELFLFASPWSPPAFMKDNGKLIGGGKLKKEFYPTYAEYFAKFIQAYAEQGIRIDAVTVQNEAHAVQTWESCLYTAEEESDFAANYLRPTLDKHGLHAVKIIIWDHNRERVVDRAMESFAVEGARDAVWGMGYHWYSGKHFEALDAFRALYPEKEIFETEFCHEIDVDNFDDDKRNMDYAVEYVSSLHHGASALCDWNLILDSEKGGPYHCRTMCGCAAAFYCDLKSGALVEDGIYNVIYTITSKLSRGDKVVLTTCACDDLREVAVKKQNGEIWLFVLNTGDEEREVNARMDGTIASFRLPANTLSANLIV